MRLLFDAQPLAFCRLARVGWRSTRVHAASDRHACETVEEASSRDRVRPSLSRALQVFPGGNRRLLFYQVVRYVERKALRANLGERAESWRWSSLRRVEREDPAFPILSTWPLPRPTDWLHLVNQPQTEAEVAALRCCVNRGRPFGDPNWVTDAAKRLGLECAVRPRGRPKKQSYACHVYLYSLCSPDLVGVTFPPSGMRKRWRYRVSLAHM